MFLKNNIMENVNDFFNQVRKIRFRIEVGEVLFIMIIVLFGLFIIYIL
jgi:hypothetical protein